LQQLHSQQQAQQAALSSFAALAARFQAVPSLAAAPAPTGSFSPFPNFVDPDNLAGDLSNRRSNPIQRPSHLCDDDAVPAIFDLSNHSGVRKVKSVLGTHAAFEIETLGCSLSWLFDHAAAATEILEAVQRLPPSGPNNTVSPEHMRLVESLGEALFGLEGYPGHHCRQIFSSDGICSFTQQQKSS
jgi:hypothetical protein